MFNNLFSVTIFFIVLQQCFSERRILEGKRVSAPIRYMVYIVKAKEAYYTQHKAWTCGGAIVTPLFIITSADCLADEQYPYNYAIAGYNKFVESTMIDTDPCTRNSKKKIVSKSVPKFYKSKPFSFPDKTTTLDIAVVEVDSPYQLGIKADHCTHAPGTIDINYHSKYQAANVDAMVLGWGHNESQREYNTLTNYNQEFLHWASVLIVSKKICKAARPKEMAPMLDNYMICTNGKGMLNELGQLTDDSGQTCIHNKRAQKDFGETESLSGFCQHDQGGPLVGWVGGKPILLGVQSAQLYTMYNETWPCHGPFMYVSTHCNGGFLNCVIKEKKTRMADCNLDGARLDYDIYKKTISWENLPVGRTNNDFLRNRKQQLSKSVNAGEHYVAVNGGNDDNTGYYRKTGNNEFDGDDGNNGFVGKSGSVDNTGGSAITGNNHNSGINGVISIAANTDHSGMNGYVGNTGKNLFAANTGYKRIVDNTWYYGNNGYVRNTDNNDHTESSSNAGNNHYRENSEFAGNMNDNFYVSKTGNNGFTNNNDNADNNGVTAYTGSNDAYIVSSSNTDKNGNNGNNGNNGFSGDSAYKDYNTMLREYDNGNDNENDRFIRLRPQFPL